jgi:predicted MFS family arabinose efflux permease
MSARHSRTGRTMSPAVDTISAPRVLVAVLVFVGLVVAVVGSLGAPLITAVAERYHVSLAAAQWTLTIALLSGAIATPLLGRLGSGPRRRAVVLDTLAVVVAGSALTVLPLPFALLLIGRAAQGVGLGLTALMMAGARAHLPRQRSAGTIALLSVASTAGIGVGYPLAGLLTDLAGIRAAYAFGLAVTAAALVAALVVLPPGPARLATRVDMRGRCCSPSRCSRCSSSSANPTSGGTTSPLPRSPSLSRCSCSPPGRSSRPAPTSPWSTSDSFATPRWPPPIS